MSVDLRNFIQINLKYFQAKPLNRTRDTAVLVSINPQVPVNATYTYYDAYKAAVGEVTTLDKYVDCFFKNGGIKLHIIGGCDVDSKMYEVWGGESWSEPTSSKPTEGTEIPVNNGDYYQEVDGYHIWSLSTATWVLSATKPTEGNNITSQLLSGVWFKYDNSNAIVDWIYDQVVALPYTEIVITSDCSEEVMREVQKKSTAVNLIPNAITNTSTTTELSGYKEKMYITSTNDSSLVIPEKEAATLTNYIIKYGEKGIEMAAAAYLTQVNISNSKTIADYCYTIENVSMFTNSVVDDNDLVVLLANKHFNVNTTLVNATRNIMGDTISGLDMMNYYIHIILTQTLTERIMTVLASKIKYDKSGVNKVINAMIQELDIYKNNGYLSIDDIWTEEDLYYTFNNVDYLVCKRNTPLTTGYKVTILPLSSLTTGQKQAHVFPPIYVLISDSISIRQIVISGDIY